MFKLLFSLDHLRITCVNTHVYMYVKEMRYLKLRAVSVDIMFSTAIGKLGSANKRELGNARDELILAMY